MQSDPKQIADLTAMNALIERDLLFFSFDQVKTQIFVLDAQSLRMVFANRSGLEALQISMRSFKKRRLDQIARQLSPDRIFRLIEMLDRSSKSMRSFRGVSSRESGTQSEIVVHLSDGETRSISIFVTPLENPMAEQRADIAEEQLTVAIDALSDGFAFYDKNDRLVVCNRAYKRIYKESARSMVKGASFEEILRYGLERNQFAIGFNSPEAWLAKRMRDHKNCKPEIEQRLGDGRWLRILERPTKDGGRVGLRIDITEQKKREAEVRRLMRSDELTGLLNRRGLKHKLEILSSGLLKSERLAIFLIDLDRFKSVNDVYGHEVGNRILEECGKRLSGFLPQPDAVARLGSDEFAVVIHGVFDDDGMLEIADEIVDLISNPFAYSGQNLQVGASIGISYLSTENATSIVEQINASDIALNEAKREIGNSAVIFRPKMRDDIIANIEIAKDIRRGLNAKEFLPFFQPQLNIADGSVVGFEALIRWKHPTRGMVPAFNFLEVAQRVGLTDALDDLVMNQSCAAARQLIDWGLTKPCVSINLSIAQISDPRINRRLQECLDRYQIEPENIRVELLESTLLDERASVIIANVHELIGAGFEVELDDFGTGHAAIATLRKFEVSRIKVDRSLVTNIDKDSELQVITSALIDLVKNLGIDALAEGVETEGEQAKLCEIGCFVAQGYLHARPMPLCAVREWLQEKGHIPSLKS